MNRRLAIALVGAGLFGSPAFAGESEDAELQARLLGPLPEARFGRVPAESPSATLSSEAGSLGPVGLPTSWLVGLGALALGLAAVRKPLIAAVQTSSADVDEPMTVVARERLGGLGAAGGLLTLLDVQDGSGEIRRLLVGSGADGPRLVADLSIGTAAFSASLDASIDASLATEEA